MPNTKSQREENDNAFLKIDFGWDCQCIEQMNSESLKNGSLHIISEQLLGLQKYTYVQMICDFSYMCFYWLLWLETHKWCAWVSDPECDSNISRKEYFLETSRNTVVPPHVGQASSDETAQTSGVEDRCFSTALAFSLLGHLKQRHCVFVLQGALWRWRDSCMYHLGRWKVEIKWRR